MRYFRCWTRWKI